MVVAHHRHHRRLVGWRCMSGVSFFSFSLSLGWTMADGPDEGCVRDLREID